MKVKQLCGVDGKFGRAGGDAYCANNFILSSICSAGSEKICSYFFKSYLQIGRGGMIATNGNIILQPMKG